MFGANKPFGASSTFGASSFGTTTTAFGQNTTAFGAKPATSNVFGTTTFGASTPSAPMGGGLFGATTPSTGVFGQTPSAFGASSSATTGAFGGFGGTSTSGNLFGATTPATQSGSLFGSTGTSAFGAPRPTFGGFGASATPSTGLFGQTANPGTGLFGTTGGFTGAAQSGTTIKFNPPTGTDTMMKNGTSTSIGTRHQCITCMKEYENKSLEELRVEDYAANRKTAATGMGFGAPQPQPSLFGAAAAPSSSGFSFGATTQAKPLFGTTGNTSAFGASTGLFGQPAQPAQNTGLFGKTVGFGAPATSTNQVFSFGGNTGTSLFGQTSQQKPLFGQPTASTGLFGSTATTQSAGFGTNTGFGAFGAAAQPTTNLFGAKPTGFGTTNTTTTSTFSFGNTPAMGSTGLFGQKPTAAAPAFGTGTAFGTPSSGFGAFGTTPAAGTNLFGQAKPTGTAFGSTGLNLFGGASTNNNTFGTTGFGTSALGTGTGTGLFGSTMANKPTTFGFGANTSTGFNFGSNPAGSSFSFGGPTPSLIATTDNSAAAIQQVQQQILAMTANPFGYSPLFKNTITETSKEAEILRPTNPAAQKALLNDSQFKVSLLPTAKMKPKPWSPAQGGKLLFDGLEDEEPSFEKIAFRPKKSIKKLLLKNTSNNSSLMLTSTVSPNQSTQIDVSISYNLGSQDKSNEQHSLSPINRPKPLTIDITNSAPGTNKKVTNMSPQVTSPSSTSPKAWSNPKGFEDSFLAMFPHKQKSSQTKNAEGVTEQNSLEVSSLSSEPDTEQSREARAHPTGITLRRPSYYTVPSLDELATRVDEEGNCFVTDFAVGREHYGKVCFSGVTNVAGLNLDEIVSFSKKEINMYPDDNNKPPVGEELNRPAVVTLENVWPNDKTYHSPIKDPDRIKKLGYGEKIEKHTSQLGAKFISYDPKTGYWVFGVDHFSKYGLDDSDEEVDVPKQPQKQLLQPQKRQLQPQQPQKQSIVLQGQSSPGQNSFLAAGQELRRQTVSSFRVQDQDMEVSAMRKPFASIQFDDENMNRPSLTTRSFSDFDFERIQGMKASFFDEDIEDEAFDSFEYDAKMPKTLKNMSFTQQKSNVYDENLSPFSFKKLRQEFSTSNASLENQMSYLDPAAKQSNSSVSVTKGSVLDVAAESDKLTYHKRATGMTSAPKIVNKIFLKTFSESMLHEKQHLLNDTGYLMGRRFRCGWSADGSFTVIGRDNVDMNSELLKKIFGGDRYAFRKGGGPNFSVSLEKVPSSLLSSENIGRQKALIEALELQLENSVSTVEDGAPIFIPKPGVDVIHAHANLFTNQQKDSGQFIEETEFVNQCVLVWDLLISLWGRIQGLEEQGSDYAVQMARREALSRWLIKATEKDINQKVTSLCWSGAYLKKIFAYMCGRRTSDACELAQQSKDYRLSLLLSQAEGNTVVRKVNSRQLFHWKQNDVYDYIKKDRIVLYVMLAGILVYEDINCCSGLEWKQALSLHLWYQCNTNASIQEAIQEYEESFQGTGPHGKYSSPPYPAYIEMSEMLEDSENENSAVYDTLYHLLKLYCDRSHRFDLLLMPETYTADHLDYRLSWLLHLALSSVGYNIPPEISSTLHMNFASQLEAQNLWQWAIFILLHHQDTEWKVKQVKDILLRNISLEQNEEVSEMENFLVNSLQIPIKWIYDAKATKAHSSGKHMDEAWFLLKAEHWSKSHAIFIKHLAADAIINEDSDFLTQFLNELSVPERSSMIPNWANGGQVYLDYIKVCKIVKDVLSQEVSAYDLEKFTPEVHSLCGRLSSIPAPTLKDRLSIAEMAKKTATILRSISILQASRSKHSTSVATLTTLVKNLPMPYDYKASEYRFLMHRYLESSS